MTSGMPHPEALENTVDHLAEIIRQHVSLDPAHFQESTSDAAWAIITDAVFGGKLGVIDHDL